MYALFRNTRATPGPGGGTASGERGGTAVVGQTSAEK